MSALRVLLRAYYERLYERMEADRARLVGRIDQLLPAEIERQGFGPMEQEKVQAYREACLAFVEERLETYNPVGIQYTFDRRTSRQAAELEFQLDWYDSRGEYEKLVATARIVAQEEMPDELLRSAADGLIRQVGAFPDLSIISGYNEKPTLQKLPDYIVASAIEQVICRREPGGESPRS
ncbi:MAG: hypothetical protein ACYTAS_02900 [Planctomycetota bacterium]|jgi:hypothetical protein